MPYTVPDDAPARFRSHILFGLAFIFLFERLHYLADPPVQRESRSASNLAVPNRHVTGRRGQIRNQATSSLAYHVLLGYRFRRLHFLYVIAGK